MHFNHGIPRHHLAAVCDIGKMPTPQKHRAFGFLACAMAGSLWGTGFFFGKIALAEMSVGHMVFYRFLFGFLAFLPVLIIHGTKLPRKHWGLLLLGAFLGVPLQFLIQFKGLSLTTVAHASLMVGTMPVILAIGAAIFAHERMDRTGWLALIASTTGAALIASGGARNTLAGGPTLAGDLLVVLSLCIALFWVLLNKHMLQTYSTWIVSSYTVCSGFLMLAVYIPFVNGPPPVHGVSLKAWLALAASGVLCTSATTSLWNWGMTQVPASQAGVFLNLEPLVGSILGITLLHETLGPTSIAGGILIVASAVVLTMHSKTTLKKVETPA